MPKFVLFIPTQRTHRRALALTDQKWPHTNTLACAEIGAIRMPALIAEINESLTRGDDAHIHTHLRPMPNRNSIPFNSITFDSIFSAMTMSGYHVNASATRTPSRRRKNIV